MSRDLSRSGEFQRIADPLALGQAIRRSRKAHGLTQTELAGLAGTGLRFVSELERGKPTASLDKTLAVLAVLGLRLLLGEAR
ncbi:MAG: helix-turn-helix transcriptional regulator [Xanthomonadales bacterium]|nr:helix-turn-helix transcriptional regulator [Xanthomonadales bacterium]